MVPLHQNMANCRNTLNVSLTWRIFLQDVRMGSMCEKYILADTMFKISIGCINPDTNQFQKRLGSRDYHFITSNTTMAGYLIQNNIFTVAWPTNSSRRFRILPLFAVTTLETLRKVSTRTDRLH